MAVMEGALQFIPTADGASNLSAFPYDEDSSDTAPSPLVDLPLSPLTSDILSPCPNVPALIAQFTETIPGGKSVRSESLGEINIDPSTLNMTKMSLAQLSKSGSVGGSS